MVSAPPSRSRSPRLALQLAALAVLLVVVWVALTAGNPLPSRTIVMATGPEGGGFEAFGRRYQEVFRRAGVDLRLVPSGGGAENVQRLRDPGSGVSVAFVESGLTSRQESPDLRSLGAVTLQPLWLFLRSRATGSVAQQLAGKRISIGPEGSGTRVLARRLLTLNGVDEASVRLAGLAPDDAADSLIAGTIDAAVMLTSWQSPAVQRLLKAEGIVLASQPRAGAYVALFPSLTRVTLPAGVADLARNIPEADVPMLAVEASLLVRRDLHPAVQYLLLEAAFEVHGGPDAFSRSGTFPAAATADVPLSDQARTYYRSGQPFVYRHFPYWLAGLVERLLILLPVLVVLYPVARVLPGAYAYLTERRIFMLYGELSLVERALEEGRSADLAALDATLEDLARRANHLRVPLSYSQRLFILKGHIAAAREHLQAR